MKRNVNEMFSLNSEFNEFELQKLEERLETDPLAVGGLLDLFHPEAMACGSIDIYCPPLTCIRTE